MESDDLRRIFDQPAPERSPEERTLRNNLVTKAPELQALLEKTNGIVGYEDAVYRFYSQSFKVFAVQSLTVEIVAMLRSLVPGREFHPFFRQVIEAGTEKTFTTDVNRRWVDSAGPVLQAFLHARYFLEMGCKYREPPQGVFLDSRWMALRFLYGAY